MHACIYGSLYTYTNIYEEPFAHINTHTHMYIYINTYAYIPAHEPMLLQITKAPLESRIMSSENAFSCVVQSHSESPVW